MISVVLLGDRGFYGSGKPGKLCLPSLALEEEERTPPKLEEQVLRQNSGQGFRRAPLGRVS